MSSLYNTYCFENIRHNYYNKSPYIELYYPIQFSTLVKECKPVYTNVCKQYLSNSLIKEIEQTIRYQTESTFQSESIDEISFNSIKLFDTYISFYNKRKTIDIIHQLNILEDDVCNFILSDYLNTTLSSSNNQKDRSKITSFYNLKYDYDCNEYYACVIIIFPDRIGNGLMIYQSTLEEGLNKLKYLVKILLSSSTTTSTLEIDDVKIDESNIRIQFKHPHL